MSTSFSFNINDFLQSVKTIAQGGTLSTQAQQKLQTFINNNNMVPELNRKSFATITKSFLEKSSFTMSGNITYTGTQTFTGTVNIPGMLTQEDLDDLEAEVKTRIAGIDTTSVSSGVLDHAISGASLGSVKSAVYVPFSANYTLNLTESSSFEPGTFCKFTTINKPDISNVSVTGYATQFTVDSGSSSSFTGTSTNGTNGIGYTVFQEITVVNISGTIEVYSSVIFMAPSV